MREKKEIKEYNSRNSIILCLFAFLMIIFTRLVAGMISPCFDYIGYGAMRPFITKIITAGMWFAEIIIIAIIYKKKCNINILSNPDTRGQELPTKNMIVLTAISIAAILLISVQIGFQVKPFYDFGVKFNGYEFMGHIGDLISSFIRCIWIVIIIRFGQDFIENCVTKKKGIIPWGGIILLLTVGVYDIIVGYNTLAATYFILNIVYGIIYLLTKRSFSKTFLFIILIFFF